MIEIADKLKSLLEKEDIKCNIDVSQTSSSVYLTFEYGFLGYGRVSDHRPTFPEHDHIRFHFMDKYDNQKPKTTFNKKYEFFGTDNDSLKNFVDLLVQRNVALRRHMSPVIVDGKIEDFKEKYHQFKNKELH